MARRPENINLELAAGLLFSDPWSSSSNMTYPFMRQPYSPFERASPLNLQPRLDPVTPCSEPVRQVPDMLFDRNFALHDAQLSSHSSISTDTPSDYGFPSAQSVSSASSCLSSPTGFTPLKSSFDSYPSYTFPMSLSSSTQTHSSSMASSQPMSCSQSLASSQPTSYSQSQPISYMSHNFCQANLDVRPTTTRCLTLPQPALSYVEDCCATGSGQSTIVPNSINGSTQSSAVSSPHDSLGFFMPTMPQTAHKKHQCNVCGKRFTRPSSLKTHSYCHSGEKPYTCEHPGCGRRFSVVSNLRRHRKVHSSQLSSVDSCDTSSYPWDSLH